NGHAGPTQSEPASSEASAQCDSGRRASAPEEEPSRPANTTPADRIFESQLLEAILSSNNTTDQDTAEALEALIGSRASGARPASEGSEAAASGGVDAFGSPILDAGGRR